MESYESESTTTSSVNLDIESGCAAVSNIVLPDFFAQKYVPEVVAGLPTYFTVEPHMAWTTFLYHLPNDTHNGLAGWKACNQCRNSWAELSTLATTSGNPVYFGCDPSEYPVAAQAAVRAYQNSFRKSPITDKPLRCFPVTDRHSYPNLGHKVNGKSANGVPYPHCFLETGLLKLTTAQQDMQCTVNKLIHQELPDLERYLQEWNPIVIDRLIDWYNLKGESAAGYRVNMGGLRMMSKIHKDLAGQTDHRQRRCVLLMHLLKLFSGSHPHDAQGAIHVFSRSSNLAACRDVSTPEMFWNLMDDRYNPITYRQPTSTPSVDQVNAALKIVNNDLSCFERILLTDNDPHVTNRVLWRSTPAASKSIMTPDQLLSQVKTKNAKTDSRWLVLSNAPSTCFDQASGDGSLNVDQFEKWLTQLPAGTKLEFNIPDYICPLMMGKPTTIQGQEMVKVPVGWTMPTSYVSSWSVGLTPKWCAVRLVLPHPGRWRGDTDVVTREQAIVSDGYVIQLDQSHTWDPAGSCLFAEFFRGKYHDLGKTRQELHTSLRMAVDTHGVPLRGVMVQVKLTGNVWKPQKPMAFRATLPSGSKQSITVV